MQTQFNDREYDVEMLLYGSIKTVRIKTENENAKIISSLFISINVAYQSTVREQYTHSKRNKTAVVKYNHIWLEVWTVALQQFFSSTFGFIIHCYFLKMVISMNPSQKFAILKPKKIQTVRNFILIDTFFDVFFPSHKFLAICLALYIGTVAMCAMCTHTVCQQYKEIPVVICRFLFF